METPFFSVSNLSISFGGIKALVDIGFTMEKGEIFSVIGPNGAGKTTLFNCISGLYRPDKGKIWFMDHAIEKKSPDAIARLGIARTFQNIELFSHMNTMENIMLGRHIHMRCGLFRGMAMWGAKSFAAKEEIVHRRAVEKIIDLLELQNVRNTLVGALPYGTQKLIELGRALALEPALLLLDEPCAGMNTQEKEDMIFWIKDIQDDLGISILLIEHDMKMVMDISSRVLAINFGKPITLGTPGDVQQNPEVLAAYIGQEE
ncbi:MAG: ABC transporter ATP-binding protein [Proteobacteria bacterium]|nr:ABC transporter ATP-binding protein [Desulfobacula sp.]MBU3951082.1 ABC transporter ATP-binding protein [Pseudomonadota bacterium]MBU4132360.1 ABC transporter ATP-binding protein [Pseudomonadota bacterium]